MYSLKYWSFSFCLFVCFCLVSFFLSCEKELEGSVHLSSSFPGLHERGLPIFLLIFFELSFFYVRFPIDFFWLQII